MGFASAALWIYAVRSRLLLDDLSPDFERYVAARALAVAMVFAVSVPIAFISPLLAELSWLAISLVMLVVRRGLASGPTRPHI
jgi:hypothetical protein